MLKISSMKSILYYIKINLAFESSNPHKKYPNDIIAIMVVALRKAWNNLSSKLK